MKKLAAFLLSMTLCAALLVGCGGSGDEKASTDAPAQTDTEAGETAGAETVGSEAAGAETKGIEATGEGVAASDLKVAICLSGAINDMGWNQSAYDGLKKACEKYGIAEPAYTENLQAADIAAAFADYAANGYNVVVGHGFEFGDPALEVAEQYPDVIFICTEANASADNVASYVMACEQTAYVEGVIAASMTKSNKIGAIGPIQGGSLIKIINGYEDGAKSVNPDIEYKTAWTNDYVDTQLAMEAANAMIDQGVDIIKHCANACGTGAINAAIEANIYCQGDSYDQQALAPDNMLESAIYNVDVVLDIALGDVINGTFKGDVYNLGMADGAVEVSPLSDLVPDDVKALAQETIDKIISGEIQVEKDETLRQ